MREVFGADIQNVAGGGFGQYQRVTWRARHDVEEGKSLIILIDLVAGQFAAQDLGKNIIRVVARHFLTPVPPNPYGMARLPQVLRPSPVHKAFHATSNRRLPAVGWDWQ